MHLLLSRTLTIEYILTSRVFWWRMRITFLRLANKHLFYESHSIIFSPPPLYCGDWGWMGVGGGGGREGATHVTVPTQS